jgi:hypothetical protein
MIERVEHNMGGGILGTFSVMVFSLLSGLLGMATGLTDWLSGQTAHLTPVGATLVGTVIVGVVTAVLREGVGLAKWLVERRDRRRATGQD